MSIPSFFLILMILKSAIFPVVKILICASDAARRMGRSLWSARVVYKEEILVGVLTIDGGDDFNKNSRPGCALGIFREMFLTNSLRTSWLIAALIFFSMCAVIIFWQLVEP